jgi:integrase
MPRPDPGPQLRLFGPDARFGAKRRTGFKEFIFYIVWREAGKRRERSTGTSNRGQAEIVFAEWLTGRDRDRRTTAGPRSPSEMTVADALDIFGDERAPQLHDAARVSYAIDAMLPFWGARPVSDVKAATCRRYGEQRKRRPGTIRRELEVLRSAINYCVREGYLTQPAPVTLPAKPVSRDRWLTRQEAARLIRAARKDPRAKHHLPIFILIGLYTGARKESILQLQWQANTVGGWVNLERGLIDFNGGRPVTKKRRAKIPIPHRLLRFLLAARKRTRKHVIEIKGKAVGSIKHSFATACTNAKLKDVTPHILKHTCITWLLQRGVPDWEVAGWTETSVETIRRTYGHHSPAHLQTARRAFD